MEEDLDASPSHSYEAARTMTNTSDRRAPHVALVASAGMGHLGPMIRLAAALSSRGCDVSFVSAQPTVSLAESNAIAHLLAHFPKIQSLHLPLVELNRSNADPFFLRFEAINLSAHRLPPLLSSSSGISAIVVDITLAFTFAPVAKQMNLLCYVLFASSASMLSLCAYFPTYCANRTEPAIGDIDINGVLTIPKRSVIPFFNDPNHFFTVQFVESGRILPELDGIIINSFGALEPETLSALNDGGVASSLPPVYAVGPLHALPSAESVSLPGWLDRQPEGSVVYVSFGNRTAMSEKQMEELGLGLEASGWRFLWVVKTKVVDRDEGVNGQLERVLGEGYLERVKGRGMVVNGWVEQTEALRHKAVGGFVSHCGWNSVTEAAMTGVRMLGWPRIGDQRVNGEVVRRSGLGVWMEEWSWEAEGGLVGREEIGKKVREMMENETLRRTAAEVGAEATKAVGAGGSSDKGMEALIGKFKGL